MRTVLYIPARLTKLSINASALERLPNAGERLPFSSSVVEVQLCHTIVGDSDTCLTVYGASCT